MKLILGIKVQKTDFLTCTYSSTRPSLLYVLVAPGGAEKAKPKHISAELMELSYNSCETTLDEWCLDTGSLKAAGLVKHRKAQRGRILKNTTARRGLRWFTWACVGQQGTGKPQHETCSLFSDQQGATAVVAKTVWVVKKSWPLTPDPWILFWSKKDDPGDPHGKMRCDCQ